LWSQANVSDAPSFQQMDYSRDGGATITASPAATEAIIAGLKSISDTMC
jgi:hypothetical protein